METEEEPEVQISDQDINPIVLDASVSDPQQGLRPPGDFLVPLDPEEYSSENLPPRIWSASRSVLTNRVFRRDGKESKCKSVTIYVKHRLAMVMEFVYFFLLSLTRLAGYSNDLL